MSALGSVTGLPTWHPPREVLEIAELVLSGAITALSAPIRVPDEHLQADALVLEDAEGTPVAVLRRGFAAGSSGGSGGGSDGGSSGGSDAGTSGGTVLWFEPLRAFTHGPVRSARRDRRQVQAELAESNPAAGVLVVPVQSMLAAATVEAVLAQAASSGQA